MKIKFLKSKKKFKKEEELQQFLICYMISNLAYFREMHLSQLDEFRKVVLQTDSGINWTDHLEYQDFDSLESHQDLFDFSF